MRLAVLLIVVPLLLASGCGVAANYWYDAGKLDDRLALSLSQDEVRKRIGKPDRVIQGDGGTTFWEYQLYEKGEWKAYLLHCPWHPYCYFPGEASSPYYIAFQSDRLCLWGSPAVVRTLAWRVCGRGEAAPRGEPSAGPGVKVSVVPVFMPPPVTAPIRRLAMVPLASEPDDRLGSWMDLTVNFLRSRHPQLVLVEREDLRAVLDEMHLQYLGRVDDQTMARVGRLAGADSLLAYRLSMDQHGDAVSASLELRLLQVESGITLFRQVTTATSSPTALGASLAWSNGTGQFLRRLAIEEAAAYGLAALRAAFGDNPLGIVPDPTWPNDGVKLLGLLQGGPAYRAGLKEGDRILESGARPLHHWTDAMAPPVHLTVERDGTRLDVPVEG